MSRSAKLVFAIAALTLTAACSPGGEITSGAASASNNIEEVGAPTGSISPDATKVGHYGIGQAASEDEIAGWDIDIRPDGMGLPEGSGSVEDGEMLYEEKCASCHGSFGEAVGRYPVIAGGFDTLTEARPEKTVGSYWPYASTLWDYIRRAMPFTQPQSLSDEEVYAITAYVLYLNDIVDDDFVLSRETFASIEMPNAGNFYSDDRPDVHADTCMSNCKDPETIKITSEPLAGVTPSGGLDGDEKASAAEAQTSAQTIAPITVAKTDGTGARIYQQACGLCHDAGVAGAPVTGDASAWKERVPKGRATLNAHAIEGFQGESGVMPAKGGQTQLSDAEVSAAVGFMLEKSGFLLKMPGE